MAVVSHYNITRIDRVGGRVTGVSLGSAVSLPSHQGGRFWGSDVSGIGREALGGFYLYHRRSTGCCKLGALANQNTLLTIKSIHWAPPTPTPFGYAKLPQISNHSAQNSFTKTNSLGLLAYFEGGTRADNKQLDTRPPLITSFQ